MRLVHKAFLFLFAAALISMGQESNHEEDISELPSEQSVGLDGIYVLEDIEVVAFSEEDANSGSIMGDFFGGDTGLSFGSGFSSTMGGERLQRILRPTLGDTLAGQPGVTSSSYSPGTTRPIIRGLDGFRVATQIDGLGTMDLGPESPDHGVAIDPLIAKSIEIHRGPSALRFGSGAIGGAVNTITGIRPTLIPEGNWDATLTTGYNTQGDGKHAKLGAKLAEGLWAFSFFTSQHESGDTSIPGRAWTQEYEDVIQPRTFDGGPIFLSNPTKTLPNSYHDSATYSVGASFGVPDSVEFGLSLTRFDSNQGIPYFYDGTATGRPFGQSHTESELSRIDTDFSYLPQGGWGPFSKLTARLAKGWYDRNEKFEGLNLGDIELDEGTDFTGIAFERDATEARFELHNGDRDSLLHGITGTHFEKSRLHARRFTLQVAGTDDTLLKQETAAYYSTQKLSWEEWSLEFGVRGDFGDVSRTDPGNAFVDERTNTFSQSMSLGWDTARIPGLVRFGAKLTASLTDRAPSAVERYAFWDNESLGNIIIGGDVAAVFLDDIDGPLDNEKAKHIELSFAADWGWGSAILTGYETDFDNFIFLESRPDLGFENTAVYVARDARIRGMEAMTRFSLWESKDLEQKLELELSGDWMESRDLKRRQELPRMPTAKISSMLTYEMPSWDFHLELRRSFGSGSTPLEPIPEFSTSPYTLLNAGATWQPAWADDALTISLRGTNLLNEEIREHTSFRKETSPQPGRGVSVELEWTF